MSTTSSFVSTSSLLLKLTRPRFVFRRLRELGIARLATDIFVKRWKVSLPIVMSVIRLGRIAFRPIDYLASKSAARRYVAQVGNPLEIPDDKGFRPVSCDELPESREVLMYCRQIVEKSGNVLAKFPDRYGINLLADDGLTKTRLPQDLCKHHLLVQFALNPKLVAAAAAYLGETPALASVQIYCTTTRETLEGNNLFHFDKDKRTVKFWMAITDINEESGPFTFFPAEQSKRIRKNVGYFGRLNDEAVYTAVPKEQQIEFKGPAGSMLLVDTCRCAHFGSRTRRGPRIMLLIEYDSDFSWAEGDFYFQPVLYDKAKVPADPFTKRVLKQLRERPPGRRAH